MKKVLAAVLAAAMSLGMASVAMAAGNLVLDTPNGASSAEYEWAYESAYLDTLDNKTELSIPSTYKIYSYSDDETTVYLPVSGKNVKVRADVKSGKISVNAKRINEGNDYAYVITVKAKWGHTDTKDSYDWEVELDVNDTKNNNAKNSTVFLKGKGAYSNVQQVYSGDRKVVSEAKHTDAEGISGSIFEFVDILDEITRIRCNADVDVILKSGNYDGKRENMRVATGVISEVEEFFDDIDVDYFDFVGTPKFATNVEVHINADKGTYMYTYNKDSGELEIFEDADYKDELNAWVFTAKKLGTYIIAEEEEPTGNVKDEPTKEPVSEPTETPADKSNPGTGANDMVGAAAALAVVSLIAAGAVAFKKASK